MYKPAAIFLFLLAAHSAVAQTDTLFNKILDEIVVTATRTERKLGNVAVPVRVIDRVTIQQAGSQRLKDILQEQTGLFITNGFGAGLQLQGLNPDYTLFLIDGEPLVGRTAGVLDLNRLTTGNIKKIEIVKGPSSSLYGSEAMAGVVNIITDHSFGHKLDAGIRYGFGNPDKGWAFPLGHDTFKNLNLNLGASSTFGKLGLRFFSDAYYLDGISYRPFSSDRVPQPIWRLTNHLQLRYAFSPKTNLGLSFRHEWDHIKQEFAVSNNGSVTHSYGSEINRDINISPVLTHQFNKRLQSSLRFYTTLYNGSQHLRFRENLDSSYIDKFVQHFYRVEDQTDLNLDKMTLSWGAGGILDEVRSTRYDDSHSNKQNTILYGFVQQEWRPADKWTVIAGLRYDHNRVFAAAWSPKLALRYKLSPKISLNASIGRGFKAPDFRQLYLNFTNNAAGGYSVFGSIDAVKIILEMQQKGQIAEIKEDFYKLKELKPEFSTGVNIGGSCYFSGKLSFTFNLFRNDIDELIDVRQVATKSNGAQVFSYINVKNAFTQGGEGEVKWQPFPQLKISSGYQLLFTADKEELSGVKAGKEFTRDANGFSRPLRRSEYTGLPNRSRHMANLQFHYGEDSKFFATVRLTYRSEWAVADRDGNGLYNRQDEFAPGFISVNISAGRQFKNGLWLNAGMDNLFNYRDIAYQPNLPGRMIYLGARFTLSKKQTNTIL